MLFLFLNLTALSHKLVYMTGALHGGTKEEFRRIVIISWITPIKKNLKCLNLNWEWGSTYFFPFSLVCSMSNLFPQWKYTTTTREVESQRVSLRIHLHWSLSGVQLAGEGKNVCSLYSSSTGSSWLSWEKSSQSTRTTRGRERAVWVQCVCVMWTLRNPNACKHRKAHCLAHNSFARDAYT